MPTSHVRRGRRLSGLAFGVFWLFAQPAFADTLTVTWNPNPSSESVAGYYVYSGQSGNLTNRRDAGNTTNLTFSNIVAGQQYCFQVSAYTSALVEGPRSPEVCGYSNQIPTLANPGARTSTVGQSTSLQLVGSDPDGSAVSYSATGVPPG